MRRLPFWTLAAATLVLAARPAGFEQPESQPARSPANASYQLEATLNPSTSTIRGSGRILWRNITTAPAHDLRFHLYWNAWRDANSSWMREQTLGRNASLARRPAEDFGRIELGSLVARGVDLLPGATFVSPDDGNPDDRTVLAVPLDTPVLPGETLDIDIAWVARVPRTFARTGRLGSYHFIAQWFPKLGVFEDSGQWNAHQFHAATEFFSDFGNYDVAVTVPAGWVVGATGLASDVMPKGDGEETHHFVARDVHDFAWTASPDFVERTDTFDEAGLPPVSIRLLLQPEHANQAERHFDATRATLRHYGRWFGAYPYSHVTVVDPVTIVNAASQGGSTGGMEYPMLFTAGTRVVAPFRGARPESVTVHEAGHQFWFGVVATNEFEHAWMDEGLNTYATAKAMDRQWPDRFVTVERYFGGLAAWAFTDVPWSAAIDGNRLNAYRPVAASDVQATPTWQYWPGTASQMSYNKTALWLTTLERYLGWETVQQILSTHFSRGAFNHPTPDQFFAIASEVAGQDLTWFFDATVRSNATFDYGVAQVTSTRKNEGYESVVVVRRFGDGIFPVTVRRTYENDTSDTVIWDGRAPWKALHTTTDSPVVKVEVDPDRVLMLDLNYTNNSWSAVPQAQTAAHKWSLRWMGWLQEVMLTYAFFS